MALPVKLPEAMLRERDELFEREFTIPKPDHRVLKDPVKAQLEAYNEHDLGQFLSCFAPEVEFVDAHGKTLLTGSRDLFRVYSGLFKERKIKTEAKELATIGNHTIHKQVVHGAGKKEEEVVVVYTHEEGLIRRVQFFR
jgi:hypothetical protein